MYIYNLILFFKMPMLFSSTKWYSTFPKEFFSLFIAIKMVLQDCAWAELAKLLYQIIIANLFMISHSEGLVPKNSHMNGFSSWWAPMKENRFLQFLIRIPLLPNLMEEERLQSNADWKGKVLIRIHYFLWMSGVRCTHLFFLWINTRELGKWLLI